MHTGNQHLRNHRGRSLARSDGLSVAVFQHNVIVSGMFQRTVTFPVDFSAIVQWMFSNILRWSFTSVASGV